MESWRKVLTYLADTSALTRRGTRREVRAALEPLFVSGRISTCAVVDLEILYAANSPAACAERAGLTVFHYDADFERIAAVTGQPTRWVVPRGSVS